ncbi:hypothetical protein [Clostridium taeniosporum]|uniref:Uncharacterized protein n=1 Tax=Clostridium taeniosporum TaxID=394958 RepID=A0A1D7XH37_9CLOT|nr:hypothetical protein [Clostridium taeniosporum]AOR22646.1 hypothetical protein BGI42_02510 [Clostridium taeniosporum]
MTSIKIMFFIEKHYFNIENSRLDPFERIKNEICICNKIYEKADIKFCYDIKIISTKYIRDKGEFFFFNKKLPEKFFFPIVKEYQLSEAAYNLFFCRDNELYRNYMIRVYCFYKYHNKEGDKMDQRGGCIPSKLTKLTQLKNLILLGNNRSDYTLAHELSHILLNDVHDERYFVPENNIFKSPVNCNTTHIFGEDYEKYVKQYSALQLHRACKINQIKIMKENAAKLISGLL